MRYCDLFDERSRLATLRRKLRQFNLSNVVFTLSRISVLLGRQRMLRENKDKPRELQELLISNYIRICELDRLLESSHSRIEKVTPVLIVQESILRFSAIEEMLNDRFVRLLKQKRISDGVQIAPLAVIDIDTLEQMKPNLTAGDFTLQQCLNLRAVRDPGYRSGSWHDFLIEFFPKYATRADAQVNEKFEAIMDRGTRNIFGN
jgi:hypothetical protein